MQSTASRIDYGTNRSGERMLRRQWSPAGAPRAVALLIHGIAEHCGRYEAVGAQLAQAGIGAVSYDQRGHGATAVRLGHVEKFEFFLDDVEDQLAELGSVGVPVVLIGHSMGGLISTAYAVSDRPQPDYLVLSGPALDVAVPAWQQTLVHKLAQLSPKLHPKMPFDPMVLSRDPAVAEAYTNDPLIKGGASVGMVSGLITTAEATRANLDRLRIPTLCLHGGDDELVPPSASAFLEGLPGVERRVLDGLRHEIFNEPEGPQVVDQVIDQIVAWINDRP